MHQQYPFGCMSCCCQGEEGQRRYKEAGAELTRQMAALAGPGVLKEPDLILVGGHK
jgi:hypothetical protein